MDAFALSLVGYLRRARDAIDHTLQAIERGDVGDARRQLRGTENLVRQARIGLSARGLDPPAGP